MLKTKIILPMAIFSMASIAGAQESRGLSFDEALKRILTQDKTHESESLSIESRSFEVEHEKWSMLPTTSVGLEKNWTLSEGFETNAAHPALYLKSATNIFAWGRDSARSEALSATQDGLEIEHKVSDLEAENRASMLLLKLLGIDFQIEVAERIHQSRVQLLAVLEKYYALGRLPKDELDRFAIDLERLDFERSGIISRKKQLLNELNPYLGTGELEKKWPLESLIQGRRLSGVLDKFQKKTNQSPEVMLKEMQSKEKKAEYEATRRSILPTLDFTAQVEKSLQNPRKEGVDSQFTLAINIPLISPDYSMSRIRSRQKASESQEAALASTSKSISDEWDGIKSSLELEWEQHQQREKLIARAEEVQSLSRKRFERGLLNYTDFAQDESRMLNLLSANVDSEQKIHEYLFRLCHIQGQNLGQCVSLKKGETP